MDGPWGVAFAPEIELERADGKVEFAALNLLVQVVSLAPGEGSTEVVESRMAGRVQRGHPGRFAAVVAGRPARGFDWTDGVQDILSFFVELHDCLVELSLARAALPQTHSAPLMEVASSLLVGVRWLASPEITASETELQPSHLERRWTVWRQDDNGNRFLMSSGHTQDEANRLCAEYEARGHKQMYWTERGVDGER
ncbi:MAG: hypothetical protein U0271_01710 [Polyangiaceae bacterium]